MLLMVISLGIYTVSTGRHPMMDMMYGMKCGQNARYDRRSNDDEALNLVLSL